MRKMSDSAYARKLAREYGITDAADIAAIERTLRADLERSRELEKMAKGAI